MTKIKAQATTDSDQDKVELSIATVLWAADRTLLAWIRTSLTMIGFGFIIHQAAKVLHQEGLLAINSQFFGLGLWIFGIIILIYSSWEYFLLRQQVVQNESVNVHRLPLVLMVAMGMCVVGLLGLIGFLVSQLN